MLMPEARVAPPVSALEATRLALALYGVDASARPLPGEYDDNFHLVSSDSREFVLKIMHPARERAFVIARQEPPPGLSPKAAAVAIAEVLESIGDTCPECPPRAE